MKIYQLRKELRAIGFKVKTESLSWGKHATFTDMEGNDYPSLFFSDAERNKWNPLRHHLDTHREELCSVKEEEGIMGLMV